MIQLLFLVLFAEGMVALLLMVKIGPLRELAMKGLYKLKTGKGPVTVKTVACTMAVVLASSVMSMLKIQNRSSKLGTITPMDQSLWRTNLLEASLIGYSLFLGLVIDRLHHYLRELMDLRLSVGASKQEVEKLKEDCQHLEEKEEKSSKEIRLLQKERSQHLKEEEKSSKEIRLLQEEISSLTENLQKLKSESEEKEKRAVSAEASAVSLQKQAEALLFEYDRLLEENGNFQSQFALSSMETIVLQEEISSLTENLRKLKSESEETEKRAVSAEASVASLRKQAEVLLLEYDRLLEDNQNLQSQFAFSS